MRKFTILLFVIILLKSNAQNSVGFTYDGGGNMIQRSVVIMQQRLGQPPINPFSQGEEDKNDSTNLVKFKVFPNPTKEFLNIDGKLPEESNDARIFLFNNSGQKLLEDNYSGGEKQIQLSGLASGIYYLEVKYSKKQSSNYKIIIAN